MKINTQQPRSQASLLPGLRVDKAGARPMYWQLYDEIKRLVLGGVIPGGTAMPSPRLVASEYECSRHTVSTSYEYLIAEGILEARHGVGTFVSQLPGLPVNGWSGPENSLPLRVLEPSRFAAQLVQPGTDRNEEDPLQKFGMPDADLFPWAIWAKLYTKVWAQPKQSLLNLASSQGHAGLRHAICDFAHRTRGIRATPEQIVITSGTTQSLDLLIRALLNPGDKIWMEDPGRPKAAALVRAQGIEPVCVPVDDEGMQVEHAIDMAPDAKAALITASHHYPTGVTMSLERRIRLLGWANQTGGWVFEDDYDGEIVADGKPILPVYSLGGNDRIVYMGTFSKSISPQLRLGYLICHPDLVKLLLRVRHYVDYFPPMAMQPVLADFIAEGHLESHIRRMRRIYRERQAMFAEQVKKYGLSEFTLSRSAPTLFQPLRINNIADATLDRELAKRAQQIGIPAHALSSLYLQSKPQAGVVVGTGRLAVNDIPAAVQKLVAASVALRAKH
jgi:GntR family transcriptional regulator / MocR family aminotransferase